MEKRDKEAVYKYCYYEGKLRCLRVIDTGHDTIDGFRMYIYLEMPTGKRFTLPIFDRPKLFDSPHECIFTLQEQVEYSMQSYKEALKNEEAKRRALSQASTDFWNEWYRDWYRGKTPLGSTGRETI